MTILELEERIQEFEELDINCSIEEIKLVLNKVMLGYKCLTRVMDSSYAFRARINPNGENFREVSELWYPPKEKVKTQGRLNKAGESIFYISASSDIATLEIRPEIGDVITILGVKLKDFSKKPHVMELGLAETASQYGINNDIHLIENTNLKETFKDDEQIKKNLIIRGFLMRNFTKIVSIGQEKEFSKSIAIAEILMESEKIHGILYPSIAGDGSRKGGGMNMAIKTKYTDELFMSDHVWTAVVEEKYEKYGYVMRHLQKAKCIKEGSIIWS